MNYREQQATGMEWRRCSTLHIYNPLSGPKTCRFDEENAVQVGAKEITVPDGYLEKTFDPVATFPLLDPATGQPTEVTMTHGQLYQALFSLYMQTAIERDVALLEVVE